jgi:hypothetical protein
MLHINIMQNKSEWLPPSLCSSPGDPQYWGRQYKADLKPGTNSSITTARTSGWQVWIFQPLLVFLFARATWTTFPLFP